MYKVIEGFRDRDGKSYKAGDSYTGVKHRVAELLSNDNRENRPFIKAVKKETKKEGE